MNPRDPTGSPRASPARPCAAAGRAAACVAGTPLLESCRGLQSALDPAADEAQTIELIWRLMLAVCGTMFVLVLVFLGWALVRARRPAVAPAAHGRLMAGLYAWMVLVLAGLFLLGLGSFLADRRLLAMPQDPVLHVRVTSQQWWWQVEYPDETDPSRSIVTANELHLPLDRTADIELRTEDVIHSLWIPNLAGKQDLIPGRSNHLRVTPRRAGRLRGQCAEFCGLQHAWMALDVRIEDGATFDAWRRHQSEPATAPVAPAVQEGARMFADGACPLCHALHGSAAASRAAPDLTHVAGRATLAAGALPFSREALRAWLADPQRYKPGTHMPAAPPGQRERLVDYLMTLE